MLTLLHSRGGRAASLPGTRGAQNISLAALTTRSFSFRERVMKTVFLSAAVWLFVAVPFAALAEEEKAADPSANRAPDATIVAQAQTPPATPAQSTPSQSTPQEASKQEGAA